MLDDLEGGKAVHPDEDAAKLWFALHLLNSVFDPADPSLTSNDILERAMEPINPSRWAAAFETYRTNNPAASDQAQVWPEKEVHCA